MLVSSPMRTTAVRIVEEQRGIMPDSDKNRNGKGRSKKPKAQGSVKKLVKLGYVKRAGLWEQTSQTDRPRYQ